MISKENEDLPQGRFFVLHDEPKYKIKRKEVDPGARFFYQYHYKRTKAWIIEEGRELINLETVMIKSIHNDKP